MVKGSDMTTNAKIITLAREHGANCAHKKAFFYNAEDLTAFYLAAYNKAIEDAAAKCDKLWYVIGTNLADVIREMKQ